MKVETAHWNTGGVPVNSRATRSRVTLSARMEFPDPSCAAAIKSKYVLSLFRRSLGDRTGKCVLSHTLYVVISQTSMCSLGNIGYHGSSLSALSTEGSGCYITSATLNRLTTWTLRKR